MSALFIYDPLSGIVSYQSIAHFWQELQAESENFVKSQNFFEKTMDLS